jgi:ribonuclease D
MFGDTPLHIVEDASRLADLVETLESASVIGIDTESNSMYAYTERVCLIQFSVIGEDWIVDPLAVKDLSSLGPVLADRSIPKVLHGADYDVRCLHRDYGFRIHGLFDTLIAAQLLAMPKVGLADLLERFFGLDVDKQFQRHDWARRPLLPDHLFYARGDTHYLMALREILLRRLEAAGRVSHVEEECLLMEQLEFEPREFDPDDYLRLKGIGKLSDDQMRVLRRLFVFREKEAERVDRPPFKVIPNRTLVDLARQLPDREDDLPLSRRSSIRRKYAKKLLREIEEGLDEDWKVDRRRKKKKPKRSRKKEPSRLTGRAADRAMEALKNWRNDLTEQRGFTSHNVVSNAVLKRIASARPYTLDELRDVQDVRNWQAEEFGEPILDVLEEIDPRD